MTKPIHDSLKRVLDVSNHSIQDIADLLDISVATVIRWSKHGISQAGANKLGKCLSLDPHWILTGETAEKSEPDPKKSAQKKPRITVNAAHLEYVEKENGVFVLREVGSDDPWVSIGFSDKLKEMIGQEMLQIMGQHMIQAGIASFIQKQMSQYHAHVYDEAPKNLS